MTEGRRPARVLCLAGPTGSGKTALALGLADALGGEIVNADSRQVYRDFPVITAQPDAEERSRAPHHLYGWLGTDRSIDVAAWMSRAAEAAADIAGRGGVPILVGGTGMYFQALLRGIADIPRIDGALRAELAGRLAAEGAPRLHEELGELDPALAARLHPNDSQRILRGLEVALGTGRPLSLWQAEAAQDPPCEGPLLVVSTPLRDLEPLLKARIGRMVAAGALEEAERAWRRCPDAGAPGWSGIGCGEILSHLLGRTDLDTCLEDWLRNTRAYAKRQITWFRGRKEAVPVAPGDVAGAVSAWRSFLGERGARPARSGRLRT